MARPPKKDGEARDRLMQIRLLQREYESFSTAAQDAGLDLSEWVRERLKKAAKKETQK